MSQQQQQVVPDVWFEDVDVYRFNEAANKVNEAKIALAQAELKLESVKTDFETKYKILRARDQWNVAGGFAVLYRKPECDKTGRPIKMKE